MISVMHVVRYSHYDDCPLGAVRAFPYVGVHSMSYRIILHLLRAFGSIKLRIANVHVGGRGGERRASESGRVKARSAMRT